jgi:hypothetical protein
VERYGITKRGEQYTGWKALPAVSLSHTEAETFLVSVTGLAQGTDLRVMYRAAAQRLHPDVGGKRDMWEQLQRAKTVLGL